MHFWYTVLFHRKKKKKCVIENLFLLVEVIARKHVGTQDTSAHEYLNLQGTLAREHVSTQGTLALKQVRAQDTLAREHVSMKGTLVREQVSTQVVENRATQDTFQSLKVNFFCHFYVPFFSYF